MRRYATESSRARICHPGSASGRTGESPSRARSERVLCFPRRPADPIAGQDAQENTNRRFIITPSTEVAEVGTALPEGVTQDELDALIAEQQADSSLVKTPILKIAQPLTKEV